jgi:hypothetical protein
VWHLNDSFSPKRTFTGPFLNDRCVPEAVISYLKLQAIKSPHMEG